MEHDAPHPESDAPKDTLVITSDEPENASYDSVNTQSSTEATVPNSNDISQPMTRFGRKIKPVNRLNINH